MIARLPPLTTLRAFEAAARLGSFSRAAEEISVTHSAVSHQVRALERALGTPLFQRNGKRVSARHDRASRVKLANHFVDPTPHFNVGRLAP